MQDGWINEVFSTCEAGVSSAFDPELIPQNQLSWLRNGRIRGGKQHTRPFLRQRLVLPAGFVQGVNYFSVQGGMLVMSIAGRIYRIRVGINDASFSYEEIPLEWLNSPVLPDVWMQETVGSLVIQDGQSLPIIYDGSTARRSNIEENEVPLGRMMAYGNGRLWVAINTNEVVAGDIKTRQFQSELKFTETTYFLGGGAFYFQTPITGMKFVPASGAAGYGSLAVFGLNRTDLVRADVAYRDLWATMPGFIQPLLLSTGAIGQFSITEVNQDIFWRDGDGGIRSLRTAIADEVSGPGLAPISREVARITDYESVRRLSSCSSIYLDNRLLMTASPFINTNTGGKTSFRDLIALDFSPVSSMRGKSPPSYDGEWDGLLFDRLVSGKFNGTLRGFAVSTDEDGNNRLWELVDNQESDTYYVCAGTAMIEESPPPMVAEYPARIFGDPKRRKRLERCDLYLSEIEGDCEIGVYFRADNYQKWTLWDTVEVCSNTTDPGGTTPHVWKNLLGQDRPQIKTFSITDESNEITHYALKIGFQHQIRTVIRGKCKIQQMVVYASVVPEEQFADRDQSFDDCMDNDVTGNEIQYLISPEVCPASLEYFAAGTSLVSGQLVDFGLVDEGDDHQIIFKIQNNGDDEAEISGMRITPNDVGFLFGTSISYPFSISPGGYFEFPIEASYTAAGTAVAELNISSNAIVSEFSVLLGAQFNAAFGPGSMFKAKQGDTYAFFPTIPAYVFNDFTMEIWVYVYSSPSPDNFGRIVDHSFSGGFDIQNRSTNRIFFEIMNDFRGGGTDSITPDTWQHFAFRRTGTQLDIFKNGEIIGGGSVNSNPLNLMNGGAQVRFGTTGGGEILEEKVSDYRVWDYARSDSDILNNYQVRLTGSEPGLAIYYPLSESDSVFADATGVNIPLTLVNGLGITPNANIGWVSDGPPPFM